MKVGKRFQPRILTISANIIQFPNSTTNIFDLTFYFHSISTFEPVQSIFGQKMWFLPSRFFFLPHVIFLNLEETLFSFNSKQFFHVRRENFLGNLELDQRTRNAHLLDLPASRLKEEETFLSLVRNVTHDSQITLDIHSN